MATCLSPESWTYGAEHEWADWPLARTIPEHLGKHDRKDWTIVNSNGIANDPHGKTWHFGGEINTEPTGTPEGQVEIMLALKALLPEATINHRSNLHIHIRVPGLRDDLALLKQLQTYIHKHMPKVLPIIEPIPKPTEADYPNPDERAGAQKRYKRRCVSHHTLLHPDRLQAQLGATTVNEFFEREAPWSEGQKRWLHRCQKRVCVNLRQLRETDTVEFRHFPGTLDEGLLLNCLCWCRDFLLSALDDRPIGALLKQYSPDMFPPFPQYVHWMECGYQQTKNTGALCKDEIARNAKRLLGEDR